MATEVKVFVVSFQNTPKGIPPYLTLAGHSQTTNEQNPFALMVVEACEMDAMKDVNAVLLNESTDDVVFRVQFNKIPTFFNLTVVRNTCLCPIRITI